jgi:hypothetical protein
MERETEREREREMGFGIAGSCGSSIFNSLRNLYSVLNNNIFSALNNVCNNLHSHQQLSLSTLSS